MELFKCVLKAIRRLLFSLSSINQYCILNVPIQKMCIQSKREAAFQFLHPLFYFENVCSKQAGGYFLISPSTFLLRKCVFKASRRLVFSFFIHCSTSKICIQSKCEAAFQFLHPLFYVENVCSKQVGICFVLCSFTVLLRKFVFKASGGCFLVPSSIFLF